MGSFFKSPKFKEALKAAAYAAVGAIASAYGLNPVIFHSIFG
jgi:hypothetical protein